MLEILWWPQQNIVKHKKIVDWCFRLQLYSAEITQTEPIFVSKTRFYHITTKSEKNSGIFCQTAEFYVGLAEKPRQDLATVPDRLWSPVRHSIGQDYDQFPVPRATQSAEGGRFLVGSALQLFLSGLIVPHCSGQIPETVALYYSPRKYQ